MSAWGRAAESLNPTQRSTLERLAASREERPRFPAEVAIGLRNDLGSRLAPIADRLEEDLFLNKYKLDRVLGCEVRPEDDFEWSAPKARGAVGHKAIELSVMRRDSPHPLELVDDAIGALVAEERSLGEWLGRQDESTIARVRAEANARLVSFLETWPPIEPKWVPVLEGTLIADFDRIRLSGRPDLTLGRAEGEVAGKVIVDFKTGRIHDSHVADLRFYGLVDTLRIGTPPRLLVTSYLDSGQLWVEEVTEGVLIATIDRVVDAAGRLATLTSGERDPEKRPGLGCRWCAIRDACDEGAAFLRAARDEGTLDDEI
ncbi:MAG: PD-(D/E)XK nuclease family protein [Microthrixaceae bacterium]|nr:PD-(D/E)XK nuclease family protein [Microthrixaceae bacterium]